MKHTQGKWQVGQIDLTKVWADLPNGMKTCVAWSTNEAQNRVFYLDKNKEEMKANAKLIADCPLMFSYIEKKAKQGDLEAIEIIKRHA